MTTYLFISDGFTQSYLKKDPWKMGTLIPGGTSTRPKTFFSRGKTKGLFCGHLPDLLLGSVLLWSKRGWVANGQDFKWDLKSGTPTI